MEGARDAHSECHIFRSREEIKIVHLCGFKKWTESKGLRVAGSGSMWGRRLREQDLSDGTGCLEGRRSSSPESGCGGASAQRAAWPGPPPARLNPSLLVSL